jgi:hypothetical protein
MFFILGLGTHITAEEKVGGIKINETNFISQIPETSLDLTNTETLIRLYLNSMYAGYILIYDNINDAFKHAYSDFNGLRELLTRKDVGEKLIELYQRADPQKSTDWKLSWEPKEYDFTFSITFIEVLFAQEVIINQLSESQVKILISELIKKNSFYSLYPETYSLLCKQYNLYSIVKVIVSKEKDNSVGNSLLNVPEIDYLLKTGKLLSSDVSSLIIEKAQQFLNTH